MKHSLALVVDDEPVIRVMLTRILRTQGFEVIEAIDGAAAYEAFLSSPGIDVVVTDMVMPKMDGIELGCKIKERCPELPIIYVSAYPPNALPRKQSNTAFVGKPFSPAAFLKVVTAVLASAQTATLPTVPAIATAATTLG